MTAHPDDYTALGKYIRKLRVPMNAEMRDPPTDQDFESALYGAMSVPQDMRKMVTEAVHHAMVSRATTECVLHNLDEASKPRFRRPPCYCLRSTLVKYFMMLLYAKKLTAPNGLPLTTK